jgi:hypothetical protein
MKLLIASLTICILLLAVSILQADIPETINFQGVLTDDQDNFVDGSYTVTFSIYSSESGGSALWSETTDVTCMNGLFDVVLGLTIPLTIDFDEPYWLGCTLAGDSEMTPRYRLTSVPYAYWTAVSDSAKGVRWSNVSGMPAGFADGTDDVGAASGGGWVDDGNVIRLENSADSVGIGVPDPRARLDVKGRILAATLTTKGLWSGYYINEFWNGETNRFEYYGDGPAAGIRQPGAAGGIVFRVADSGTAGDSVAGVAAMTIDIDGNIGVGTGNPEAPLHVAGDNNVIRLDHAGILDNPNFWISQNAYFDGTWQRITDGNPTCGMAFNDELGLIDFHTDSLTTGEPSLGNEESLRLRIANNGNIGIGTMSPARRLHITDVMRLEPRASAPSGPSEGDIYMDSVTHKLMVYDGTTWRACW